MVVEEILEHYGVKGMKWGIRKGKWGRKAKIEKNGPANDAKSAHRSYVRAKNSGVEALTTKELRALNERLQLEKKYTELSYNPSRLEKGQQVVKRILGIGTQIKEVHEFANSPTGIEMQARLGSKTAIATKAARAAAAAKKTP